MAATLYNSQTSVPFPAKSPAATGQVEVGATPNCQLQFAVGSYSLEESTVTGWLEAPYDACGDSESLPALVTAPLARR